MHAQGLMSLAIAGALPLAARAASGSGSSTRYWDCCKPSCAWPGKAATNQPVFTCDKSDQPLSDFNTKSGCESGGSAFTCTNQSPWAANDLVSYGFAATAISGQTEAGWCCACYQLTFTSGKAKGKIMVVQSVNTGGDLGSNQFDLQIPGGGVGIFDGCSSEFGNNGLGGARYGGISNRSDCASMPAKLQPGCQWRFDWFRNSDNPSFTFKQVQCPAVLTSKSGCKRTDDSSFPAFVMPSATTWTPPTPTETAAAFAQCDSLTWDVAKACPAGYSCQYVTDYYWQCAQGGSSGGGATTTTTAKGSTPTQATSATTAKPSSGTGTCAAKYGQCGGQGWAGPTCCAAGSTCKASGQYYSQCL